MALTTTVQAVEELGVPVSLRIMESHAYRQLLIGQLSDNSLKSFGTRGCAKRDWISSGIHITGCFSRRVDDRMEIQIKVDR